MKIQEYKTRIRYIGFQWNGENIEEVQKSIKEAEDYLNVVIPYEIYESSYDWGIRKKGYCGRITFRTDKINLPVLFLFRANHVIISEAGGVQIASSEQVDNRFKIVEWEDAK